MRTSHVPIRTVLGHLVDVLVLLEAHVTKDGKHDKSSDETCETIDPGSDESVSEK